MAQGRVTRWESDEAWGVLDSPQTPGGCLVIFFVIEGDGYRELAVGETVEFDWEAAEQEGFHYRATRVVRASAVAGPAAADASGQQEHASDNAYSSRLTIDWDETPQKGH